MHHQSPLFKQRGIALLEVMLSISVIALILVMATRFFYVANNNSKTNIVISQVGALVAASETWRGASIDTSGISIGELGDAGLLDNLPGVTGSGKDISMKTPWGDTYSVSSDGLQITINVSLPHCGAVLQAFPNSTCHDGSFRYSFQ